MRKRKSNSLFLRRQHKLKKYGNKCYLCGKKLSINGHKLDRGFTLDHVVAQAKGGLSKKENLKPCCKTCNERKAAMDVITLKAGTKVKVNGIPFELAKDTVVFCEKDNTELIKNDEKRENHSNKIVYQTEKAPSDVFLPCSASELKWLDI